MNARDAPEMLAKTLCRYFKRNPYSWFHNFEKVLHGLNASYYEGVKDNRAIHIDIYSAIATNPTWGKLSETDKRLLQNTGLFKKLLSILNPDIIVFSANKEIFTEVFGDFKYESGKENIGGKKGFYIRKYTKGKQVLLSGLNLKGQPFGGLSEFELNETLKSINI